MLFLLAALLLVVWLCAVLFGRGGFWHILLLCAAATAVIETVHRLRARQQ